MRLLPPLLLITLLLLTACDNSPKGNKSTIIYCAEGAPLSFNPHVSNSRITLDANARPLYDGLLRINPDSLALEGALATSWHVSDDGLTYTLHLRDQVTFHQTRWFSPSRYLNSSDVIFTYQRMLDKNHPFHPISDAGYAYFYGLGLDKLIRRVYSPPADSLTVVFELNQPNSAFLAMLASDNAMILSAEYAAQLLKQDRLSLLDSQPIGTGPFQFREYRHNDFVRYLRHPSYWGDKATPEQLIFDITPKSSKRLAKLLTGECDVMGSPIASQLSIIKKNKQLHITTHPSENVAFLALNTRKAPFDNVNVRQAIASAINVDNLLQAIYFGTGQPANSLLPPQSWAYDVTLPTRHFDPLHAKQLLKEAGLSQGVNLQILIQPDTRPYNPDAFKMAQLIRNDLANIGIKVEIVQRPWAMIEANLAQGTYEGVLSGWIADSPDPNSFFRQLLSCMAITQGNNQSQWCHPQFDQLLHDAVATSDVAERQRYYYQAQQLINEELPLIPLAHGQRILVNRSEIRGVKLMPFGGPLFNQAHRE